MKKFLFALLAILPYFNAMTQSKADSLAVETTMEELFTVCNSVVPEGEDPNVIIFERLAPYILYSGKDAARNKKSACDYNKVEDRKLVDKIGLDLKNWLDKISEFKVVKYQKTKKDNIDLHTLSVTHKPANGSKIKMFSFVKIGEKYLLLKID
jgi:hypothetical protein